MSNQLDIFEEYANTTFEGYYWLSDQPEPVVLQDELIPSDPFKQKLPFVIEACFYSYEEQISIMIKNIDGVSRVRVFDLSKYLTEKPLRFTGIYVRKFDKQLDFKMYEVWEPQNGGPNVENMEVLTPQAMVFGGFVESDCHRRHPRPIHHRARCALQSVSAIIS